MSTEIVYVEIGGDEQSFHFATAADARWFAARMETLIMAAGWDDDEWGIDFGRAAPVTVNEAIATAMDLWALDQ